MRHYVSQDPQGNVERHKMDSTRNYDSLVGMMNHMFDIMPSIRQVVVFDENETTYNFYNERE